MTYSNYKLLFSIIFLACILAVPVQAAEGVIEGDVIEDIELRNLERLDPDVVFASLGISIGDLFDDAQLASALKRLFTTDYFDDIRFEREGNTLVIAVDERPTIRRINTGDAETEVEEQLRENLSAQLIIEGEILRRDTLSRIVAGLEHAYNQNGQYGTRVFADTVEVGENLVDINITVQGAPAASIAQINIIGNKAFTDERILEGFESTARTTWTSFWSAGTNSSTAGYVRQRLEGDLGRLRDLYFDRGFIDFEIKDTEVSISRDRTNIYISISVFEGRKYRIDNIEFWGDLIVPESRFQELLQFMPQSVYSDALVDASILDMERMLGDLGYGFAKVNLNLDKNLVDKTVSVRLFVNPGNRTYIRRVLFKGNSETADEVLRRELRQLEGGWFSNSQVQESTQRLQRLGFFKSATHQMLPVPNRPDQLDIEFTVVEQHTGQFSGGLVYSDLTGVGVNVSVKEQNIFGTGNGVGISLNASKRQQSLNLSWNRPYITKDGVSMNSGIFFEKLDFEDTEIANYALSRYGGNFGLGYPVASNVYLGYGLSYVNRDIQLGSDPALEIQSYTEQYGKLTNTLSYNLNLTHNALNKGVFPTEGGYQRASLRLYLQSDSSPGLYSLSYNGKYFFPLDDGHLWVSRTSTRLGYAMNYDGEDQFPFLFNFYAGGYGTVRGYGAGSLGPRSTISTTGERGGRIGGNILVQATQELIFPLWFSSDSVQTSLFYDIGSVYTSSCITDVPWCSEGYDPTELRSSYGATVIWYTVVGPLIFTLPNVINRKSDDSTNSFEFRVGQVF